MNIRRLRVSDRNEWLRMRRALWPGSRDDHPREIAKYFARPPKKKPVFVAEQPNGKLAGFLEANIRESADGCDTSRDCGIGYIEGWWVDADARQRGIGGKLVRAAEQWARKTGCREMASDCVIGNRVSLKAHLALGYREVERAIHFCKKL